MSVSGEGIQRFSVVDSCVLRKCDLDQKERLLNGVCATT